jgi:endonuclease/exonuclease/phosphatase (EEP) superfamily protein YafD
MRRISFAGLAQAAGVLTIAFSLLTLLTSNHHALQLFSHFRLQYLGAAILLTILFVVLRDRRYAVLLFTTAFINGAHVLPWYFDEPYQAGDNELTLLSVNVLSSSAEYGRLSTMLESERPDIVVLQEISFAWAEELERLKNQYPHSIVEARDGNFGIALLSTFPLASAATVASDPLGFPTIVATVDVGGQALQLVATHPMIPLGRRNFDDRNQQLVSVANLVRRMSGPRVLVGDLNTSLWDVNYKYLEARTGLRNARRGFGILPTWPTFFPPAMIPIDHILVSHEVGVTDVRTGPRIGSDHLPLLATLAL